MSTSNAFGSRNLFLSIVYLVMGSLCLMIGIGFSIKKYSKRNKEE